MRIIKQGDSYSLPITVTLNGGNLNIKEIETIEICLGKVRKLYPGEVSYDSENGEFLVPLTQRDTMSMPAGRCAELDVRFKFVTGEVVGLKEKEQIYVCSAASKETL